MSKIPCRICGGSMAGFERASVLAKYDVQYLRCTCCGSIQTEEPYWLDEAYASAITRSDIGLVSRNFALAQTTKAVILSCFNPLRRFVDYGGGYGMLVRLLRDAGFDFRRYDTYAANLFAEGFDVDETDTRNYELATAFEVFEHLVRPLEDIERMLSFSRNILFTTALVSQAPPPLDRWWYYGPEHGQHVTLYSQRSLEHLAQRFKLRLYTDGSWMHLLTTAKLSQPWFYFATRRRGAPLVNSLLRRRLPNGSLLPEDYARLTGRHMG